VDFLFFSGALIYNCVYREQQTTDDARLEKEVQDVVAGKRRTRRRGGAGGLLGSDESDDDDDEEARALRQRLAKKRRITGDTLDELARDPAMASFHATYQMALVDDAEEFAHLDRDQELDSPKLDRDQGEREGGDNVDDGQDDDSDRGENNRRRKRGDGEEQEEDEDVEMAESSTGVGKSKEISAAEVRKALQEVARGERVCVSFWSILSFLTRKKPPTNRNTTRSIRRTYHGWIKIWTKQRRYAYA
jgi:hypothetical protein